MTKFDTIVKNLGWIKPYKDISLWYKYSKNRGLKAIMHLIIQKKW